MTASTLHVTAGDICLRDVLATGHLVVHRVDHHLDDVPCVSVEIEDVDSGHTSYRSWEASTLVALDPSSRSSVA